MLVTVTFQDVAENAKDGFRAYLDQKQTRLEKLLSNYPPDSVSLQVHAVYFRHHNAFEVTLQLGVPSWDEGYAQATSHALHKALDLSVDKLEGQVTRFLDRKNSVAR